MAALNLDYYTDKDYYSDGDIENVLLDMVENNINLDEVENMSYPILYHLSHVRENILNWYPFDENASLLEIGSGCGAITGMLCSKVKKVVSVELSKRRATINYKRNQNVENLTIYVGNQNDMDFGQKFDYIVLNGVFEYAMSFTNSDHPYVDFLINIGKHLKADGKLIIAIENKYGLKYFAGAPEDHTDQYFLGLNGYENNCSVRTFGKIELTELLNQAGLRYTQFYYPYPDYKFPNEIFTDESLQSNGYGREYYNLNGNRYRLFDETNVARGLVNEGVMSTFVNSFLVVASRESIIEKKKIIYAKINNDRKEQFRILTRICDVDGEKMVIKSPINQKAKQHINGMIEHAKKITGRLRYVPSNLQKDVFEYSYIEHKTLNHEIKECLDARDGNKILRILTEFFTAAFENAEESDYQTKDFQHVFGQENTGKPEMCISSANIDLICDNVFKINEEYYVIDGEWIFDFPIPVSFIKWRNINELYHKYHQLPELMSRNEMLMYFNIDSANDEIFSRWNYHFCRKFAGCDTLEKYSIPIDNNLVSKANSYIYMDYGDGYNENDKVGSILQIRDSAFKVTFQLPSGNEAKSLRWDPMEGRLLQIKITNIDADTEVFFRADNGAQSENGFDSFLSFDPRYCIEIPSGQPKELTIEGFIEFVDETMLQKLLVERTNRENKGHLLRKVGRKNYE